MHNLKHLFLFLTLLFSPIVFCQQLTDENESKIASVLNNYFDLEREAIHLHLDKTTFINNESVWYQGYIINRKTNKPYFTSNVFVLLYDEKGNQISEKLIFASNGVFSGNIDLDPKLHSGNYYIQVYTNWMNNFNENESTITKINIINPSEGIKNSKKVNKETLEIILNPEGKGYINGISNIVGIQVKDCKGNAPENLEATIENNLGETLKTFKLNKFGLGKFEITPTNESLKITINYKDKIIEKALPNPEDVGFAIQANDFTMDGKTIVKIKTNNVTLNSLKNKKIYLLAHQDQKYSLYPITMSEQLEQTIYIDDTDLFEGINTLRIIDNDMKQWCERLIYVYPKNENINFTNIGRKENNINIVGYTPFQNSYMSVSVLPENTISSNEDNNIFSGLTINPYLTEPLENANYYFNSLGRAVYYALDLVLLNQSKLKYDWNFMKTTTPSTNYSFDIGINLKGTIDPKIQDKTYHKVKLSSFKDLLMLQSDVNEKGEYSFEHVLFVDSSSVNLSLQKLPHFDVIPAKLLPQILNRKKPFYKPLNINIAENCPDSEENNTAINFDLPKFSSKSILLDEVKVINNKKKLNYSNKIGNGNLRGFKVDDKMLSQNLLDFLEANGFKVVRNFGLAEIYSRLTTTLNSAPATPDMFIDDREIMSADELTIMKMSEIDEIYLNPHAIVASINNRIGIIKIYTKKSPPNNYKGNQKSFFIKDGFSRIHSFKNAVYANTQSEGFDNFGIIEWCPRLISNDEGQVTIEVTDYNKSKGKIILEGITSEGKMFHEEKVIDLK